MHGVDFIEDRLTASLAYTEIADLLLKATIFVIAGIRETYGNHVVVFAGVGHDRLFIDGLVKRARVVAVFVSGHRFRACAGLLNNGVHNISLQYPWYMCVP